MLRRLLETANGAEAFQKNTYIRRISSLRLGYVPLVRALAVP